MCGIAGMVGLDADIKICQSLLKTMERRGPDGNGVAKFDICTLLHSRLAIIDIEGGKQPMCFEWENEVYTITYNGELYNTDEIRGKLIKLGHRFNGHSDTEVVLHAYAQWSDGCLERFNGIFAFGIWEEKSKKLFLARDRMGVKPLFYKIHEKGILFGIGFDPAGFSGCLWRRFRRRRSRRNDSYGRRGGQHRSLRYCDHVPLDVRWYHGEDQC